MLRKLVVAALIVASVPFVSAQASDKSGVEAAIRKTMQYANAGDGAKFVAMFAPGGLVIDEFAPFRWDGLQAWANSYGAYNAQNGVTAAHTTILGFKRVLVSGDRAYATLRVVYSYKANGVLRKEPGTHLFVLQKTAAGWRCLSFAWLSKAGVDAGTDAQAVAAAVRGEFEGFNTGAVDFSKLAWNGLIDNFPAYYFGGAATVADWGAAFEASGETDIHVALGAPSHLSVNGDDAYIVLPATITGKIKGKPLKEHGSFAFTANKTASGWRTRSWAWAQD